jgi:hypothetical protein
MRILAIDGALNHSGWAFLEDKGGKGMEGVKASKYGTITTKPTMSLGFKLTYIRKELIRIIKETKPEIVVLEETYSGKNKLTTARLNNAKGIILQTVYEVMGNDPIMVSATSARSCLGFKRKKREDGTKDSKLEPFEFFRDKYNLPESFSKGNDITDAFTIGWGYILSLRDECPNIKKKKTRRTKKK